MSFDKQVCMDNIYGLAKEKGIKIKDIETALGVSTGYLSRISKEGNTTLPGIDMLVTIAEKLNVSLDTLVREKMQVMNSTEAYILSVVDKLLDDTKKEKLIWKRETLRELLSNIDCYYEQGEESQHPLFGIEEYVDPDTKRTAIRYGYWSIASTEEQAIIDGDFYYTDFYAQAGIYLTQISYSDKKNIHDIFIRDGKKYKPLCSTYDLGFTLTEKINRLYAEVAVVTKQTKIKGGVKKILDLYLGGVTQIMPKD